MFGHEYEFTTPLHTRNSIQENHNYQKLVVSLMVQKKQKRKWITGPISQMLMQAYNLITNKIYRSLNIIDQFQTDKAFRRRVLH